MKNLILFIAGILLFYSSAKAQRITNFNTDASKMRIYGKVKSITEYYSPDTYIIYTFNSNNKLLKAQMIGFHISVGGSHEFKYDDKGNMNEWKIYNTNGSLQIKVLYKLDLKGNRIEDEIYNRQGDLVAKNINSYDEKGNKIQTIGYQTENLKMYKATKTTYTYDAKGNVIQENDDGGNVFNRKFDGKNNLIQERLNSAEAGADYSYTYDKFGNWIKVTMKFKSEDGGIIERKITYY